MALGRSVLIRDGPRVVVCKILAVTSLAEVLMLRLFCVALSLLFIAAPTSAETVASSSLPLVLVNDTDGAISESQNTPRQNRPVRPQR